MNILILKDLYCIYQFKPDAQLPEWIYKSEFYSVTKSQDELSVVCRQNDNLAESISLNNDWRVLKIQGILDFSLIGIIAEISEILQKVNVSIFVISTYNTDYFLVKNKDLQSTVDALKNEGHQLQEE